MTADLQEEGAFALFSAFDRNNDGLLSFEDLRQGFKKADIFISNDELKELLDKFDTDNDGALNFSEMLSVFACLQKDNADRKEIMRVFQVMDRNGNKRISKSELRKAMELYCDQRLSNAEIDDIMGKIDLDSDGYICFTEFARCIHMFKAA